MNIEEQFLKKLKEIGEAEIDEFIDRVFEEVRTARLKDQASLSDDLQKAHER